MIVEYRPIESLLQAPRAVDHKVAQAHNTQHSINWQQFQHDVYRLTLKLSSLSSSRWAICCDNSYWFAVAFFAACHADKELILPGNLQPAALNELADHFDGLLHDTIVVSQQVLVKNAADAIALPLIDDVQDSTIPPFAALRNNKITLFTSGSTGRPKAIHKSLTLLSREVTQLQQCWGDLLGDTIIASTVSHQHIYGLLFRILWPLAAGRSFYQTDWLYPETLLQGASDKITLISSPALLKRLLPQKTLHNYRAIFSSGGPLSYTEAQHSQQFLGSLPYEVFGSTETGGIAYRQQSVENQSWQLFPYISAAINTEQCLKIISPLVDEKIAMLPYQQHILNGHAQEQSWYQTCDQCQLVTQREFRLLGRIDRIIKIAEKRISLVEVERRLTELAEISEAVALPYQQDQRLIVVAAIVLSPLGQQQYQQLGKGRFWLSLRHQLHTYLEPVGIPRRFKCLDAIPLNRQGKRLISEIEPLFLANTNSH